MITERILADSLVEAASCLAYKQSHYSITSKKIFRQALEFISGTGFNKMIRAYDLELDADYLRYKFFKRFHAKSKAR